MHLVSVSLYMCTFCLVTTNHLLKLYDTHAGIPTTRAAALVVSNDPVIRDQFYDGRPEIERAAMVMRIAPSFLRFGSLEILTSTSELSELRKLLNYILEVLKFLKISGSASSLHLFFSIL